MRTKQELRKALLEARLSISHLEKKKYQDLLLIQFQQLSIPFLYSIHSYIPIPERNEPDPEPLIRWLQFRNPGMKVAVPKVIENHDLNHIEIDEETRWTSNSWGISEPEAGNLINPKDIDLIFIPLLGFDLQGNRIGYGKGFYDRFLVECRKDALKIGLSYLPPITESFAVDPWDIPLDFCLTPDRIYAFT